MMASAVVFDMDGLLLDTERLSLTYWQQAAAERGFEFSDSVFVRMIGRSVQENEPMVLEEIGQDFPYWEVRRRRVELMNEQIAASGLPLKEGAAELVMLLSEKGVPVAVATSTHTSEAEQLLESAGLRGQVSVLVGGDQIENGKPAPDIYLKAAERLALPAAACVALEDSGPGVRSAYAAGMAVLVIEDLAPLDAFERQCAHSLLPNLHEAAPVLLELLTSA